MRRIKQHILIVSITFFSIFLTKQKAFSQTETINYIDTTTSKSISLNIPYMMQVRNELQFVDTFNFKELTVDLNRLRNYNEYLVESHQGVNLLDTVDIQIFVDTSKLIPTRNNKFYIIPPPPPLPPDFINKDSLKKDNKKSTLKYEIPKIYINNYPVFIINKSKNTILLTFEDISGFKIIQEALDSSGNWRPIQYWHWNWCGNAYMCLSLQPNHYALTRTTKFTGKYKTKLRLKLRYFNRSFYSNEFDGTINYSQFKFPEKLDYYNEREKRLMLLEE